MSNAVAIVHKDQILHRVSIGHRICDIAADYQVTQPAISNILGNDPDFLQAREIGAHARIENWEKEIEAIGPDSEQVMLARAREMLSHARWRAEREFPERWGNKTQVTFRDGDLGDKLRRASERVIEGEVLADSAVQQPQRNTENGEG